MKKARFLFILMWLVLSFVYIMDGSYDMGLILCFYLVMNLINAFLCLLSGRDMELKINLPYSSEKKKETCGFLEVVNKSFFPIWKGFAVIFYENTLTGENGQMSLPFALLPKGKTKTEFCFQADYCGECRFEVAKVTVFDMFGVFSGKRKYEANNTVFVFPKTEEIQLQISGKDAYDMESFRYSDVIKGDDSSETFAIREYMSGDSMRKIHWKLTGKLDTMMVKESSFPIFNSIMLILETGYEGEHRPNPNQMDAAVEVFLSVADMFIRQEMPFEIGFYDYEKEFFCTERIEAVEELWNMVPGILKARPKKVANSAYYQYQISCGDRRFAHYLYVAADGSFGEVELAAEQESIFILRCGETSIRDGNHLTFTTENWKEELL